MNGYPNTEEEFWQMFEPEEDLSTCVIPIPVSVIKGGAEEMISFIRKILAPQPDEGNILLEFVRYDDGTLELQANYVSEKAWATFSDANAECKSEEEHLGHA